MWSKHVVPRTLAATALCLSMTTGVLAQKQIKLLVTVVDPAGGELATLEPGDVRVIENGTPATVVSVQPVERIPKLQILVDNGTGMPAASIGDLKLALRAVISALPPDVETTIVTTAPQPRFIARPTTDKAKLLSSIDLLAPDSGAGRFVDSLYEATDRVEKDKQEDASYTILSVATTSGDISGVRDRDVQRTMERIQRKRVTTHVVLLATSVGGAASGGAIQLDLGQAAAQASGGRFERINVANRLNSLLPELGQQIASTLGKSARQFRVIADRPAGASGEPGEISLGTSKGTVQSVMRDN